MFQTSMQATRLVSFREIIQIFPSFYLSLFRYIDMTIICADILLYHIYHIIADKKTGDPFLLGIYVLLHKFIVRAESTPVLFF